MADTATDDRLLEQARNMAVHLEAELALVAGLVRAQSEAGLLSHNHAGTSGNHECPTCQLNAWARSV